MAEHYRFFDSIDGEDERYYTADEFAEYFRQFLSSGVYAKDNQAGLRVEANGENMQVKITKGNAFIEGYMYKVDTEPLVLTVDTADPTLDRIDRVVIRLDKTLEKRYIKAFVLTGTPDMEAKVPTLTKNENIYEISLARITVTAGKSFIEQMQITDERSNEDVCGFVSSLISIPTSQFQDEWNDWKNIIQPQLIEQFNQWFEGVMADTDVDVDAFTNAFNAWFGGIQTLYENWFNSIEKGTYLAYENLGEGFKVRTSGKIDVIKDIVDRETNEKYRWGIEKGIAFLEKVVN